MVRLESKQVGKIVIEGNIATISFDYKAELVAGVKTLEKAKYQAENKTWKVTIENEKQLDKINEFANLHNFIITGEFVPVISSTTSIAQPSFNGVMKIDKKTLIITFQYNSETVQDLKDIEVFKKWNAQNKTWEIKNFSDIDSTLLKQLVDFGKKWNLDIDSDFLKLATPKVVINKEVGKIIEELKAKYPTAHEYQLESVQYVLERKKAFNGSTMGTGKSFMTLMSIDFSGKLPALVICPNSLKYNWALEVQKFIPNRTVSIINSTDKELELGKDIYVINYDIVNKKLNQLLKIPFKFIALDESHMVKNPKSLRYKAIDSLVENLPLEYKVLLSGTCITNRPVELVSQLNILGVMPKIVNKEWDFYLRYCNAYRTDFGWDMTGASNTQELYSKLKRTCYFRVEIEDVIKDLPEKQENTVFLDINNRREYNRALNDLIAYLSDLKDEDVSISAQHLVQIEVLKQLVAKGKIDASKEWIQNVLDSDEKLVLFAHHKEIIEELMKVFPDSLLIDGSVTAEERQKAVTEFQTNPSKKLIICSIKAASTGLTLTASSKIAFLELPWTPADLDQASARVYRIGQKNNVNIYYLLGKNTIEDLKIMPLIEKKRAVFNAVARGQEVKQKDLQTSMLSDLVKSLLKK